MHNQFLPKGLFLILFLVTHLTRAQEEYSPSLPGSFGIQGIQTTENLSSGVLNINLPIANHVAPVSISFNTGGIKVSSRPSEVGVGWELKVGGFIVREKRGLKDESSNGYSGVNQRGQGVNANIFNNWNSDIFANYSNEDWDAEPDIFRFNFMGRTGAFVLSYDRQVIKLTPNNLKIVPEFDSGYAFIIYDEQGNKYYFADKSSTIIREGTQIVSNMDTKWSLRYVEDYKTGERINFTNEDSNFNSHSKTFRYALLKANYAEKQENWTTYSITNNEYKPSSISYKNKKLLFFYQNRLNSSNKILDYILFETNGKSYLKYLFKYAYVLGRPFLSAVVKENTVDGTQIVLYQFDYYGQRNNEEKLPASYASSQQDHWGFYNDNYTNSLVKKGVGRTPLLSRSLAGNLKRVYYPGGGYEEYKYEQNLYKTSSGSVLACGGLRIKEIHKNDGVNDYQVRTYNYTGDDGYTSGELYATPDYLEPFTLRCYGNMADVAYLTTQHSSRSLYDFEGRHIVYKKVTVTNIDGGKEVYYFHNYTDEANFFSGYTKYANRYDFRYAEYGDIFDCSHKDFSKVSLGATEGWPYAYNYYGTYAGTLDKKIIYNSAGQKQVEEDYTYARNVSDDVLYGVAFSLYEDFLGTGKKDNFKMGLYKYKPIYIWQDRITRHVYDEANQSNKSTYITDHFYDATYNLPIKTETYLSGDYANRRISETTYLVQEQAGVSNVTAHNIINSVKKTVGKKGTTILSESINTYGNNSSGKVELKNSKSYIKGNLISHSSVIYSPSTRVATGNIDEITGKTNSVIFDGNNELIIAEVSNARQNEIAYTGFEPSNSGNWYIQGFNFYDECIETYEECVINNGCDEENDGGTQSPCCQFNCCENQRSSCLSNIFPTGLYKFLGDYSYRLEKGNITKTGLPAGKYILSYWKYSGTVNVSGVTSNTLLQTKTRNSWSLEEREIAVSSGATLTISGSAYLDELKIKPIDAVMKTYTYDPAFGKTSETDDNNNIIYYEHDTWGRVNVVRDDERNIIKTSSFHIGNFLDVSHTSKYFSYQGGNFTFYISSNSNWTVSENASWITINKTSGEFSEGVEVNCAANTGNSRSGTITINGPGGVASKTITVYQDEGISSHLDISFNGFNLNNMYLDARINPPPNTIQVTSNVDWTVGVTNVTGPAGWPEQISSPSGSGNGQFTISHSVPPTGGYYSATIYITGGGLSRQFTLYVGTY